MDDRQRLLIQHSFERIAPMADTAAALFYGRLFELDRSLRPMFHTELREQGRKLMHMLTLIVRGLDDEQRLLPAVEALGQRHAGYGVRPEHYELVGAALLWTLQKALGEDFTPEVKAAWTELYGMLATNMQAAGRDHSTAHQVSNTHQAGFLSSEA